MAKFDCVGLDELGLSLKELAEIPQDVQDAMLEAGADVVVPAQRRKVREYGIYDAKNNKFPHVADSIKKGKPKNAKKGGRVIYVTPKGSRKRGKRTTNNSEILFIQEFGKKGQKPRPAIRDANEECAEATTAAQAKVWSDYLASKNL